ncbi:GNAT family N-acetyltransferase [Streptomyces spirodelae]|uniref:GNAT family N-acetyltransferase n=1 Tax=Streptomyces spirodelae TaxID=2812904 RepID=A0ABS3WT12_9ACTN|nr:GNAT family N-acetyltransferase [Streptomyces spirodelae]MBO8186270.1 GNAT family N-acetyltransferase [Streptomyces spirodelae]
MTSSLPPSTRRRLAGPVLSPWRGGRGDASGQPPVRLTAALCRSEGQFAGLAADWDALRSRNRSATPFQSHAWLWSWWRSYGRRGRLRVVLVRENGRLVAAAPLMLVHRPLPVLVTLGGSVSDYQDVLLDDNCPRAAGALARALHTAFRGAVLDLREVRPGGAAERLYAAWPGVSRCLADSVCLELPGIPMAELLARLTPADAEHTGRELHRIDELGIEACDVTGERVPEAVRTMLRLHQRQWRGRGLTPEHLRTRFGAHLVRATTALVADGDAAVAEYRIGGRVIACRTAFTSQDLVCGYLHGAEPRLREERVDIPALLLRHDARYAATTGRGTLSLLRGTEPYKLRWRPVTAANRRYLLARRELAPALALLAAQVAARESVVGALRKCPGAAAVHAPLGRR